MSDVLNGRRALVTGGGRGIGLAITERLVREGVSVVLVARSGDELDRAAKELRRPGIAVQPIVADLAGEDVSAAVDAVLAEAGPIDILINNAATVAPLGPSASIDRERIPPAFRLNVLSPMLLAYGLIDQLTERGWGRIVNVSSGVVARPASMIGGNVYGTTKAAIEGHTVNLAAELEGTGVSVNVYRPGMVDTSMQAWIRGQNGAEIGEGLQSRFARAHRDGALISPEESASALVRRLGSTGTGEIWSVSDPI